MSRPSPISILIADDDPDDRLLIADAFKHTNRATELSFVTSGQELLDYLQHRGRFADDPPPRPDLVVLDLNMPGKDGREALADMKASPTLRRIPVVVLTTSRDEADVVKSYDLGVSGFVHKPVSFDALIETVRVIGEYWADTVLLPST